MPSPVIRWISSYPRSGNKVTRVLLANYLVDGPATTADMGRVAPDISSLAARGGVVPLGGDDSVVVPGTFLSPTPNCSGGTPSLQPGSSTWCVTRAT